MHIIYSDQSLMSQRIEYLLSSKSLSIPSSIHFVKLPSYFRNYFIHFFIKALFPVDFFFKRLFVFDDYPFRLSHHQVLYFHQANLLFNYSTTWSIKRLIFSFLINPFLYVYVQTFHMEKSFKRIFNHHNTISFLHSMKS